MSYSDLTEDEIERLTATIVEMMIHDQEYMDYVARKYAESFDRCELNDFFGIEEEGREE